MIKDCQRKHDLDNDTEFDSLAKAIKERVQNAAGKIHWSRACEIHEQLVFNRQQKREAMASELREQSHQHLESQLQAREVTALQIRLAHLLAPSNRSARRWDLNSKSRSANTLHVNYQPREEPARLHRLLIPRIRLGHLLACKKKSLGEVGDAMKKMPNDNLKSG